MKHPTYHRIQARTLRGLQFKLAVLRIFGWRQRSDMMPEGYPRCPNKGFYCYIGRRYDNEA